MSIELYLVLGFIMAGYNLQQWDEDPSNRKCSCLRLMLVSVFGWPFLLGCEIHFWRKKKK